MNDEKKYSEHEIVLAKRRAFMDGAMCWTAQLYTRQRESSWGGIARVSDSDIAQDAKLKFPMPKVERPRLMDDPHSALVWTTRVDEAGKRRVVLADVAWGEQALSAAVITEERVALWSSLLACPNETVEAE